MKIANTFVVEAPFGQIWQLFGDLEHVASCMPGATLGVRDDGGTYQGSFKIKLGPVSAAYDGTIAVLEREDDQGRIVLRGDGTDPRGAGRASATIVPHVSPDGASGKLAQFSGRSSLIQGVADRIVRDFAERLQRPLDARLKSQMKWTRARASRRVAP